MHIVIIMLFFIWVITVRDKMSHYCDLFKSQHDSWISDINWSLSLLSSVKKAHSSSLPNTIYIYKANTRKSTRVSIIANAKSRCRRHRHASDKRTIQEKGKTNKERKHDLSVGNVNHWLRAQSSLASSTAEILKALSAGPASHRLSCVKCKVYPLENSLVISSHEIKKGKFL
jgi:hypothetical protein